MGPIEEADVPLYMIYFWDMMASFGTIPKQFKSIKI